MRFYRFLILFLLPTFAASYVSAQDETCKLRKDKDDIKVYACHSDTSRLKSVRAEVLIRDVTMEELKAFLMDIDNYVNWQYNLLEARTLENVSDSEVVMRTVIDAPWPVSNREVITRMRATISGSGNEMTVEGKVIARDYPSEKGLVRVPFSRSEWTITPLNESDLKVEYSLRVDPGGSLPAWLVNLAVAEGPYQSFRNLKDQLARDRTEEK